MLKKITLWLIFALVLALVPQIAHAKSPTPWCDYSVPLNSGQHLFVMLSPKPGYPFRDYQGCRNESLRTKYAASGLYLANDSESPLWTVDFWMYNKSFYISTDGHYLVHIGGQELSPKPTSSVLDFYEHGKLTRSHTMLEIVGDLRALPQTFSEYEWLSKRSMNYNENTLMLMTKLNQEFTYDIVTGERIAIVYGEPPPLAPSSELAAEQREAARQSVPEKTEQREAARQPVPEETEHNISGLIYMVFLGFAVLWCLLDPNVASKPKKRS